LAGERQSDRRHVLAESSWSCKHELCRFVANAIVMGDACGLDDFHK
jgi:hypothetical protein